jgi:excisionase family DNA binding protein
MREVDEGDMELLTVDEVAAKLRVSAPTVWRRIYSGDIESVKVGRSRRIPPAAVAAYIRGLRETQAETPRAS